jgi:hypothetical protein
LKLSWQKALMFVDGVAAGEGLLEGIWRGFVDAERFVFDGY